MKIGNYRCGRDGRTHNNTLLVVEAGVSPASGFQD